LFETDFQILTKMQLTHIFFLLSYTEIDHKLDLTEKTVELRKIVFPEGPHKEIQDKFYFTIRTAYLGLLRSGDTTFARQAFVLFGLVLRVRQSCCHSKLIPDCDFEAVESVWEDFKNIDIDFIDQEEGMRLFNKLVTALRESKKQIHEGDADDKLRLNEFGSKRPSMEGRGDSRINTVEDSKPFQRANLGRSPKIQALLDAIGEMAPGEKGVIFSQWTKFLDVIEEELCAEGHTFTRIDGSMDAAARMEAMKKFETDGCDTEEMPRFILCSITACGTGISLTRANHGEYFEMNRRTSDVQLLAQSLSSSRNPTAFIMDTWWNVAQENQAMDRIHRIGQTRPVRAIRFIMADSIEERLTEVQDAKDALGKGSLEKLKREDRSKAKITAMKDLFEMNGQFIDWEGVFEDDAFDDGSDLVDFIVEG
jgi:SNF2 family DNA or RNA helicase